MQEVPARARPLPPHARSRTPAAFPYSFVHPCSSSQVPVWDSYRRTENILSIYCHFMSNLLFCFFSYLCFYHSYALIALWLTGTTFFLSRTVYDLSSGSSSRSLIAVVLSSYLHIGAPSSDTYHFVLFVTSRRLMVDLQVSRTT